MSDESIAHTIRDILKQCNSTVISIGHTEGHFLSSKQFAVLEECADTLENLESVAGVDTPTTSAITQASSEEDGFRARNRLHYLNTHLLVNAFSFVLRGMRTTPALVGSTLKLMTMETQVLIC